MVAVTIDDREVRKVTKVLDGMGKDFGKRKSAMAISRAMRNALRPLRPIIRSGTPRDTGALRRSVAVTASVTRDGRPYAAAGWRLRHGVTRYSQILGIEHGNKRVPDPAMTLQKTWASNGASVIRTSTIINYP